MFSNSKGFGVGVGVVSRRGFGVWSGAAAVWIALGAWSGEARGQGAGGYTATGGSGRMVAPETGGDMGMSRLARPRSNAYYDRGRDTSSASNRLEAESRLTLEAVRRGVIHEEDLLELRTGIAGPRRNVGRAGGNTVRRPILNPELEDARIGSSRPGSVSARMGDRAGLSGLSGLEARGGKTGRSVSSGSTTIGSREGSGSGSAARPGLLEGRDRGSSATRGSVGTGRIPTLDSGRSAVSGSSSSSGGRAGLGGAPPYPGVGVRGGAGSPSAAGRSGSGSGSVSGSRSSSGSVSGVRIPALDSGRSAGGGSASGSGSVSGVRAGAGLPR